MYLPAINIVTGLLKAAATTPTIKRVVITSSITPIINPIEYATGKLASKSVWKGLEF
jgi:hypothetical protein